MWLESLAKTKRVTCPSSDRRPFNAGFCKLDYSPDAFFVTTSHDVIPSAGLSGFLVQPSP
jgi:hypothetical protein